MKSMCQEVRRNSPSVAERSPTSRCILTTSRIAASSTARSASSSMRPAACSSRAWSSSGGRSRLPTWSARNGGVLRADMDLSLSLRLDQAAPDRVAGELDPVPHPELLEDVRAVPLHRLLADHELLGDLSPGVALGDQLEDLGLPGAERIAHLLTRPGPLEEVADQRADRPRIEERLPAHGGAAGLDQVAVGHGLEHVPGRARLQRL